MAETRRMMIADLMRTEPLDHLDGQVCRRCGDSLLDHHYSPSCQACDRCRLDPACAKCGRLTSMHE